MDKPDDCMPKVYDIKTREPLERLPFDKEQAEQLLAALIGYHNSGVPRPHSFDLMVCEVCFFIERNSGASSVEVGEKMREIGIL